MNLLLSLLIFSTGLLLTFQSNSFASETGISKSELLKNSVETLIQSEVVSKKRVKEFLEKRETIYQILSKSSQEKSVLLSRSTELEKVFSTNNTELLEKQKVLNDRKGDLNAFFGALSEATTAIRSDFSNSIISAQFSNRIDFLDDLLSDLESPNSITSFDKIQRFSTEIIREIEESGKIVAFKTDIIDRDGQKTKATVTRIGAFNATVNQKFTVIQPDTLTLSELPQQPPKRFRKYVSSANQTETGMLPLTIDPTRGQVLSLILKRPKISDRLNQGGPIGFLILLLGVLSLTLTIYRFRALSNMEKAISLETKCPNKAPINPLTQLTTIANDHHEENIDVLELKLEEALASENSELFSMINYIKFIAIISPLLGLLGTVSGMIITFQSISLFGTGDPNLMAGGISQALVTTVLGLCVAIPSLLFFTILSEKAKAISHLLEQNIFSLISERTISK